MNVLKNLGSDELLNSLPDPIIILDHQSIIEFCNDAFSEMLGYSIEAMQGTNIIEYLDDPSIFESCQNEIMSKGCCVDQPTTFRHSNGEPVKTIKNVKMIETGDTFRIFVNVRNLNEIDILNKQLKNAELKAQNAANELAYLVNSKEEELSAARMQLDEVLSSINEIIWYIDDENLTVQYVSDAVEPIFGIDKDSFTANPHLWQQMVYSEDQERVHGFFLNLQPGDSQTIDFRIQRADGEIRWLNNRIVHHKGLNFFIGVTIDITESKKIQDSIEFMAYHDSLTQLPNRAYLKEQIQKTLGRAAIVHQQLAVLFLDLDNFKYINDTMGHEVGDEVLVEVSERLIGALNDKAICTRFGGDEFIILMSNIHDNADIDTMARSLIEAFRNPFMIQEHEFFISCSIGISLYPDHSYTHTDLIKHADTAMYAAKKAGKNRFVYYDTKMDAQVNDFLRIENLIREGIKEKQFQLHYQPLIETETQTLVGFEALLRFFHPDAGAVSPVDFIPVAEATGDILTLSQFVLSEACRFIQQVNYEAETELFVSVNISARQFREEQFAHNFLKTLNKHDIPPTFIKIELTESVVMENLDIALSELVRLKEAGVRIALDDFGTGYSSFEYLAKLPIDTIKIDKSFVIDLFDTETNQHIIEAMTKLAHSMDKDVTAEGVESNKHATYLQTKGVNILQGFAISKAVDKQVILDLIQEKKSFKELTYFPDFSI
ncbi:MAG: EAL domain-containing protein [Sulfurimonadaceae bacterium]|nr:EAL domain-containing protein [Sulfurimonadaceae bacterium]